MRTGSLADCNIFVLDRVRVGGIIARLGVYELVVP